MVIFPRGRECLLGLSSDLNPGETRDIVVEPTGNFESIRLIVAPIQRRWIESFVVFMCLVFENFLSLFNSDQAFNWQFPLFCPVSVLQVTIGSVAQFQDGNRIPGTVFCSSFLDPQLVFDVCQAGQRIVFTLQNEAKRKITFRAGLLGILLD